MINVVKVKLKNRSYDILIGYNILTRLGDALRKLAVGTDAYIITNPSIKRKYGSSLGRVLKGSRLKYRFKMVGDTEASKSMSMATAILKDIARLDKKKQFFIVALGGGVIGDLAGFIASVYKRGVAYIQVPTSLLAQIDSSIGGKTAVDLAEGKNLVGAFYQPRLVFSDVKFLNTLSPRQLITGLAEAIKYGIIKDKALFVYLEKNFKDCLRLKSQVLTHIVSRCSRIKADIVSLDELEKKGKRTILNFGHTIGHAIEAACRFKSYNHGEAVALGMLVASDISRTLGLTDDRAVARIEQLIRAVGLPSRIKGVSLAKIISVHYHDKKFKGRKNKFVLTCGIGKTKIVENIPHEIIRKAVQKRM
ncbi:MAG: 3-dehydroquinate synthase [Candidatus Omnitrophota bacterium]